MRAALGALALLVAACSHTGGHPLAPEHRSASALYFIERHPLDDRDLASIIAGVLNDRGLRSSSGVAFVRPDDAEYLVTYVDRWYWDMRTYLIELRIEVRDARSGELLGFGRSYQDSLAAMGKSFRDVIERAVDELLAGG